MQFCLWNFILCKYSSCNFIDVLEFMWTFWGSRQFKNLRLEEKLACIHQTKTKHVGLIDIPMR